MALLLSSQPLFTPPSHKEPSMPQELLIALCIFVSLIYLLRVAWKRLHGGCDGCAQNGCTPPAQSKHTSTSARNDTESNNL